jgi:hypothetical protein
MGHAGQRKDEYVVQSSRIVHSVSDTTLVVEEHFVFQAANSQCQDCCGLALAAHCGAGAQPSPMRLGKRDEPCQAPGVVAKFP